MEAKEIAAFLRLVLVKGYQLENGGGKWVYLMHAQYLHTGKVQTIEHLFQLMRQGTETMDFIFGPRA